jgi:hypothetical protein
MKVFWSWQSDIPGEIARFLVRDALEDAINQLKEEPDIEEPTSQKTREDLHLDHDIKNVSGSPDLARTIFEKIAGSAVFIADVTPVGEVTIPAGAGKTPRTKKLMNSNVSIELGYALRALGDQNVLLVFNSHYASHEELPFDLRHKGGAIVFNIGPDAANSEIKDVRKQLKARFVNALKPYLHIPVVTGDFAETPSTYAKGVYFERGDVLARIGDLGGQIVYGYDTARVCYLRLIPTRVLSAPIPIAELRKVVQRARLLSRTSRGSVTDLNRFGAIVCEPATHPTSGRAELRASTQLFPNGEIWSVSSDLIAREAAQGMIERGLKFPFIPSLLFEQAYYDTLRYHFEFASAELGMNGKTWQVEMGIIGADDVSIAVSISAFERFWGPIRVPNIVHRTVVNDPTPDSIDNVLLTFFALVYDATGHARPTGRFGFPPKRPTDSPSE